MSCLRSFPASARVSGGAASAQPPAPRDREHDRADRQQRRHQCDVENFQARAEPLDLDVEAAAHVAQLLADAHALLLEAVQLGFLLGREHQRAGRTAARFELRQLPLGFLQLGVELLLLGAQLPARLSTALATKSPLFAQAVEKCCPNTFCVRTHSGSARMSVSATTIRFASPADSALCSPFCAPSGAPCG